MPYTRYFVRFCGVLAAAQLAAFLRHNFCKILTQKAAQTVPQKGAQKGGCVFVVCTSQENLRKYQKSVFLRLPVVGGRPVHA